MVDGSRQIKIFHNICKQLGLVNIVMDRDKDNGRLSENLELPIGLVTILLQMKKLVEDFMISLEENKDNGLNYTRIIHQNTKYIIKESTIMVQKRENGKQCSSTVLKFIFNICINIRYLRGGGRYENGKKQGIWYNLSDDFNQNQPSVQQAYYYGIEKQDIMEVMF
ncbi:unnamed protein product [Paramecium sonneborni]|uniref:Uncharacterized protein n=1 Tax=Paramecium sonneborni TaxID=65129 RepID=A0A8S1PF47_9CILI|nr:unnamed protein product [Paramecium sonneborni]